MSQNAITSMRGLATALNQLTAQPGQLKRADNCVIRQKGVIESRRGQPLYAVRGLTVPNLAPGAEAAFGTGVERMNAMFQWPEPEFPEASQILGQYGSKLGLLSGNLWSDFTGTWTPPGTARMKFASVAGKIYCTTSDGIRRHVDIAQSLSEVPRAAGIPFGHWHYHLSHPDTITGGFLAVDRAVAYRHLFKLTDPKGREIVGPASEKVVIINPPPITAAIGAVVRTGGTNVAVTFPTASRFKQGDAPTMTPGEANFATGVKTFVFDSTIITTNAKYTEAGANAVSTVAQVFSYGSSRVLLRILLPAGLTTSHVVQVYRSDIAASATAATGDEMGLVYEAQLTSTDISNAYVDIYDNTPDVQVGEAGYFCPSQQGLVNNHDVPLLANEVASVSDTLFAANLVDRHRLEIDLLAVGTGTNQLTIDDVLVFTRGASVFTVTMEGGFLFTSGSATASLFVDSGSVGNSIERTCLSLVTVINGAVDNTFLRAQYISGVEDAAGRILLEAIDFSTTAFTVKCATRPNAWNPILSSTGVTSHQEISHARVAWSLPSQPDAMPALNFQDVGPADEAVLRFIPVRDKAIVIKERSFWLMSGRFPNFRFDLLDDTVRTIAPDTACTLNGQVMVLTAQGVAQVSESGIGLLSLPCENDFLALLGAPLPAVKTLSWACARESEHEWILGVPTKSGDVTATLIWVWNSMSREWTQWPVARTCAVVVSTTDHLHLGDVLPGQTRRENRAFSANDFADELIPVSSPGQTGSTVYLRDVTGLAVGDYLIGTDAKGSAVRSRINAVVSDAGPSLFTMVGWSNNFPPPNYPIPGDVITASGSGHGGTLAAINTYGSPPYIMYFTGPTTFDVGDNGDDWSASISGASGTLGIFPDQLGVSGNHVVVDTATPFSTYTFAAKAIPCVVDWLPLPSGAPASGKQHQEMHFHFAEEVFVAAEVSAISDISPARVTSKPLSRPGWGCFPWGSKSWGQTPSARNERAMVSLEQQRAAYLAPRFEISEAYAQWRLQGLTVVFEGGSERTKK